MSSAAQSMRSATSGSPATPSRSEQQSIEHEDEQQEDFSELVSEVSAAVSRYCSRRPRVVAGCVFSLGFIFGWKLRPW